MKFMEMKHLLLIVLSITLSVILLTGCNDKHNNNDEPAFDKESFSKAQNDADKHGNGTNETFGIGSADKKIAQSNSASAAGVSVVGGKYEVLDFVDGYMSHATTIYNGTLYVSINTPKGYLSRYGGEVSDRRGGVYAGNFDLRTLWFNTATSKWDIRYSKPAEVVSIDGKDYTNPPVADVRNTPQQYHISPLYQPQLVFGEKNVSYFKTFYRLFGNSNLSAILESTTHSSIMGLGAFPADSLAITYAHNNVYQFLMFDDSGMSGTGIYRVAGLGVFKTSENDYSHGKLNLLVDKSRSAIMKKGFFTKLVSLNKTSSDILYGGLIYKDDTSNKRLNIYRIDGSKMTDDYHNINSALGVEIYNVSVDSDVNYFDLKVINGVLYMAQLDSKGYRVTYYNGSTWVDLFSRSGSFGYVRLEEERSAAGAEYPVVILKLADESALEVDTASSTMLYKTSKPYVYYYDTVSDLISGHVIISAFGRDSATNPATDYNQNAKLSGKLEFLEVVAK